MDRSRPRALVRRLVPLALVTALAGGILNSFERFLVPALTPVLLNLSLIGCALLLSMTVIPALASLILKPAKFWMPILPHRNFCYDRMQR